MKSLFFLILSIILCQHQILAWADAKSELMQLKTFNGSSIQGDFRVHIQSTFVGKKDCILERKTKSLEALWPLDTLQHFDFTKPIKSLKVVPCLEFIKDKKCIALQLIFKDAAILTKSSGEFYALAKPDPRHHQEFNFTFNDKKSLLVAEKAIRRITKTCSQ